MKKIDFKNMKGALSRGEMKKVTGGGDTACINAHYRQPCSVDYQCYCNGESPQPLYCYQGSHICLFR
jgi:hypothetical protein